MGIVTRIKQGLFLPVVRQYAQDVASIARKKAPTKRIKQNIEVLKPKLKRNGGIETGIAISLDKAPEARAYEKGSGIHSTEGAARKYTILPKKGSTTGLLAFKWDNAPASMPASEDGRHVFRSVQHPGVEARPYLAPAVEEAQEKVVKKIVDKFADAFFEEMKIAFNAT